MKPWSTDSIRSIKATLFLDTNIMSFLVDNTHPNLTKVVKELGSTCIFNISSSDFCLNEFVGIRKREHYLRLAIKNVENTGKVVNFSSLLKNNNQFKSDEVNFYSILGEIRKSVEDDIEILTSRFGINFDCNMHELLVNMSKDICLCSKISKEDCMVFASAAMPAHSKTRTNTTILTKDSDFVTWYEENDAKSAIDQIFNSYKAEVPQLVNIRKFWNFDLTNDSTDISKIKQVAIKMFLEKFADAYIGKTVDPLGEKTPNDVFAWKYVLNKPIKQGDYTIIIGQDLDFVYYLPNKAELYHKNNKISNDSIFSDPSDCIVSTRIPWVEENFTSHEEYEEILAELRSAGHFVFLASKLLPDL